MRLIGAHLYVAIQERGVRHFVESNISIAHSLQTSKVVVCGLKVGGRKWPMKFYGSIVSHNLMTKVHNAVVSSIARKIVDGVDTIARMKSFGRIVVGTISRQMERYVNIATISRRVCTIGDEILVETIVATRLRSASSLSTVNGAPRRSIEALSFLRILAMLSSSIS